MQRPVWAEINLKNLEHNYNEVKRLVGKSVQVMATVKANAYGHGAIKAAQTLDKAGADRFSVAIMNEAVQLREGGIKKPIMILGWTPEEDYPRALDNDIILTIYSLEEAEALSRICMRNGKKGWVHLKIDTGMGRIGFQADEKGKLLIKKVIEMPGLYVEGIFTHFAKADEKDKAYTKIQLARFRDFIAGIEQETGYSFTIKHAANSAAIIDHPEAYFDLVRPGIILYGLEPSDEVMLERIELKPVLSLKAKVSHVKDVGKGFSVSYGGHFVTEKDTVIATLPIGYADGYTRLLSGKAHVLYDDLRLPVVGSICMDQLMVNATGVKDKIKQGDIVTLIGNNGENFLTADELADILGTINYEITCMVSARVPRHYQE